MVVLIIIQIFGVRGYGEGKLFARIIHYLVPVRTDNPSYS